MDNNDLVSYYQKLVSSFEEIGYLEDAMDSSDTVGFTLLCSELGDKVIIIGNELYNGSIDKVDTGFQQKWTQCALVPSYYMFSISNMFEISKTIDHLCNNENTNNSGNNENASNLTNILQALMFDDTHDNNEFQPYFIDLSVACRCGIIRLPLPTMKHGTKKYNRWLFLNDELKATNEAALQDIVSDTKPPNAALPPTEEEPAEALP